MEAKYEAFNDAVKGFFGSYQLALNYKHDTSLNGFLLINSTIQSSTSLVESLYKNIEPTTILKTSYEKHIKAKDALSSEIIESVSDSKLSAKELTDIQEKYKTYNDTISAFIAEYQSIQNKGLKDVEDWLTDTTNGLILFVSTIGSTTETAKAVYANVGGTVIQKATLKVKYDTFIQTDSELTTLIGNSLSDSKLSSTELASIITKYLKYNTDLFGFYAELKKLEDVTKQNKLVAGNLVTLTDNIANKTTTVDVKSDPTKQNKLVALDDTITLKDQDNGTTGIKAVFTESIQEDNVSGTKILEVTEKIVTVISASQTNYIGFISNLNVFQLTNLSDLQVLITLNDISSGTDQIIQSGKITQYALPKHASIGFLRVSSGWLVTGLFGVTYFPDLADGAKGEEKDVIVKYDGTATSEIVRDIEEIDESVTTMTAAQLNARFPNAVGGFTLIGNGIKYIKSSQFEDKWSSITLTKVN